MNRPKQECADGRSYPGHQRGTCIECRRAYSRDHMARKRAGVPSRPYGVPLAVDRSAEQYARTALAALRSATAALDARPAVICDPAVRRAIRELSAACVRAEKQGRING